MRTVTLQVDRYTKCVLTVIAACLAWICIAGSGLLSTPSADAQSGKFNRGGASTQSAERVGVVIEGPLRSGAVPVYVVGGSVSTR